MTFRLCTLILVVLLPTLVWGQQDSIITINGNTIVGEIEAMDRAVIVIGTDYSDADFRIEWSGIKEIYTQTEFLVTLKDGRRYNGKLSSQPDGSIILDTDEGERVPASLRDIVDLNSIGSSFLSRLSASIDMGFSLTKAQNLRQVSLRSSLGYLGDRWSADANYSFVTSRQDSVSGIERGDGNLELRFFLPKDWFLFVRADFLSSTELKLDLRAQAKLGGGKFIIRTNKVYWSFLAGGNYNNEMFSDTTADRRSLEGFLGTEYNMFNISNLDLKTTLFVYPGITEGGRWRVDYSFDLNYDLPLDFYIGLGLNLNFDNRPVPNAARLDYVFQTNFGWEW